MDGVVFFPSSWSPRERGYWMDQHAKCGWTFSIMAVGPGNIWEHIVWSYPFRIKRQPKD